MTTTTTLRRIRAANPGQSSWRKLTRGLGGLADRRGGLDTPLPMTRILDINGLDDALWACRTLDTADLPRVVEFARRCADRVAHLTGAGPYDHAAPLAQANAAGAATSAELYAAARATVRAEAAARAAVRAAEAAVRAAVRAGDFDTYAAYRAERAAQVEIFRQVFGD